MRDAATPTVSPVEHRRVRPAILQIADLTIEDLCGLLAGSGSMPRLDGTFLIDVPPQQRHVGHAVETAVSRAGGRVLVSDWPTLWTDRTNPMGDQLRPPLRAAVIGARDHALLERYVHQSRVPILNAGSDRHAPLDVLADLLTVRDLLGKIRSTSIAFVGPPTGYRTSLVQAAARLGIDLTLCTRHPDPALLAVLEVERPYAQLFGGTLTVVDPTRAVVDVDVLIGEPTPFGLFATRAHLPLERTGTAADSGKSTIEGPRSLLFHRQQNLERIVHRLLALAVTGAPAAQAPAPPI